MGYGAPDFSFIARLLGPLDFVLNGTFWEAFYFVLRASGFVLILFFFFLCIYVLIQIWPLRRHLRVREGYQAYSAPKQRYTMEDTQKLATRKRWAEIVKKVQTQGATGYALALIEADVLLEHTLGRIGIVGKNIAERLKTLSTDEISNINGVWDAHALRNRIAHESGFVPSSAEITQALSAYKQALEDLNAI